VSGLCIEAGAMPGGGAARDVIAAEGTQAECIDIAAAQFDWHMHDTAGAAARLSAVRSGPAGVAGRGAKESWPIVRSCRAWAAG